MLQKLLNSRRIRRKVFNFIFGYVEGNGGAVFRFKRDQANEQHLILMDRTEYLRYKASK